MGLLTRIPSYTTGNYYTLILRGLKFTTIETNLLSMVPNVATIIIVSVPYPPSFTPHPPSPDR